MIDIVASNQDNPKWSALGTASYASGKVQSHAFIVPHKHKYTSMSGLWLAIMLSINVTYYLMIEHVRVNVAILHQFSSNEVVCVFVIYFSPNLCVIQ